MQRQDTYNVKVTVDGRDLGTFDKKSGGEVDSDETVFRPGGLGEQIALGGPVATSNVVVTRHYDQDVHDLYKWLVARVGRAEGVIAQHPLDADGNIFQPPINYKGKLKRVVAPQVDSEASGIATLVLEFTILGRPF
jgi:hypothetical protein